MFVRPDPIDSVLAFVDVLCEPPAQVVQAGPTHCARVTDRCRHLQPRGNPVADADLAAIALEQGAKLIPFDRGFGRYPGLRRRCLLDA